MARPDGDGLDEIGSRHALEACTFWHRQFGLMSLHPEEVLSSKALAGEPRSDRCLSCSDRLG